MTAKPEIPYNPQSFVANGNKSNSIAREEIISQLKELQAELNEADWTETEGLRQRILLLSELVETLSSSNEDTEFAEEIYVNIANKILLSREIEGIFHSTTQELRQALKCDRVAIYRFNPDWGGEFVAESVANGWVSLLEEQKHVPEIVENVNVCSIKDLARDGGLVGGVVISRSKDTYLQQTKGSVFSRTKLYRVSEDIYNSGFSQCYIRILEAYEAKAYIIGAIYQGQQLWGLLAAYQNSGARKWEKKEINLVTKVGTLFGIALQQSTYLQQIQTQNEKLVEQSEKDKTLSKIADRIRQSQDLDAIFNVTTSEIRNLFKCDRVAIYRFNPDWSGEFIAESVGSDWVSLLQEQRNNPEIVENVNACSIKDLAGYSGLVGEKSRSTTDTYLQQNKGSTFSWSKLYRVSNDIYDSGFSECYIKVLESYQARAYVIVAIYQGRQLWGLLAVYQNSSWREWQNDEVQLLIRIANQFSVGVQQSLYLKQLQVRNEELIRLAEQEKAVNKIVDRIRQGQELEGIFNITTSEIRNLLKCDRVGIYQFNPDWSGKFVAESAGSEWVSVLQEQQKNPAIVENINVCSIKDLAGNVGLVETTTQLLPSADSYIKQTQGASFSHTQPYRVTNDIYNSGFSECYIKVLETYQAKAYAIVAIYQGLKLWGLLAVYQNSNPRHWQEEEIQLLVKIAGQFSIAIQQAQYLEQLQTQNLELAQRSQREQTLAKIIEQIRQSLGFEDLCQTTVKELRRYLKADRVGVFKFYPESGYDGEFVSEDVISAYPSAVATKIHDHCFGNTYADKYAEGRIQAIADIYDAGLSSGHIDVLSRFAIRANLIVPLTSNNKLWGLLCVHQCSGPRKWQEEEIRFVQQIAYQFDTVLQQAEYLRQLEAKNAEIIRSVEAENAIARLVEQITERISQSQELVRILQGTLPEARLLLKCDRLAVYRFYPDWSGEFFAESVGSDWVPLVGPEIKTIWPDEYLMETQGGRYRNNETFVVNDVYTIGHSKCHLDILEQFQIKAYALVPIFAGKKLWGLLGAYQNSNSRQWQKQDVQFLVKLGSQFGIAVQQSEYFEQLQAKNAELSKTAEEERALARIVEKIRQYQDLEPIFRNTLPEMRQQLKCDRLAVYRFNPDWSGEFIAESVGNEWVPLVGPNIKTVWEDDYIMETQGGRYRNNQSFAVDDVYAVGHSQCHVEILEQFQVKAYIIVPIFAGKRLWGLLAAYQNSGARQWRPNEVQLVTKLGVQLGIGVQQSEYVKQLEMKNAELARSAEEERALAIIVDKIRQYPELEQIYRNTLAEMRLLLKCDRLAVYRFNPDWSGEFIAESVGNEWMPLVGPNIKTVWEDDYIMRTQGGRYRNNETFAVDDVNAAGHSQCHLDILKQFQVQAYAIAPIFVGSKLWGLLGAYQNSRVRKWQPNEVQLLTKLGVQLGIGIQQAEFIEQLRAKNIEFMELADREKLAKEKLQTGALRVLQALEPSFRGDLTVRAPLSEDEIGTIADGYNTTIQSLRGLVRQVQVVSARVSETSGNNTKSVTELSAQAEQQVERLQVALVQLHTMVKSTQEVLTDAQKVGQAVQEANRTVQAGDSLMERTVDGILEIRETVSETAKKIKRLGEASQKISKVVNLIDNFATQTNLLALNAAIEATRAGEYGKGFAVVADEVRSLAYQSANATTEIGRLVEEIQAETKEVTETMELGIAQVVQGSELVNETRQTLSAIVSATSQISELVQAITQAASTQSQQSQGLSAAMNDVSAIAHKTSENATQISASFQELLSTSQELQTSVSKFKVD